MSSCLSVLEDVHGGAVTPLPISNFIFSSSLVSFSFPFFFFSAADFFLDSIVGCRALAQEIHEIAYTVYHAICRGLRQKTNRAGGRGAEGKGCPQGGCKTAVC